MQEKKLKVAPTQLPNHPAAVGVAVAAAIKALHAGTADSHQQQIALQWIIREACGKAYFPFHADPRLTDFALGKLFVADQIIGFFNADLSTLRSNDEVRSTKR